MFAGIEHPDFNVPRRARAPVLQKLLKAMKASIVAARAKVENPAAEPEPAKEEKGETTEAYVALEVVEFIIGKL